MATDIADLQKLDLSKPRCKIHVCIRCGGRYLKTRGKTQELCLYNPICRELQPKIVPTTLRTTEPESQGDQIILHNTLLGETVADSTEDGGQDIDWNIFKQARRRGFRSSSRQIALVEALKGNETYFKLAKRFKVDRSSIRNWAKKLGIRK